MPSLTTAGSLTATSLGLALLALAAAVPQTPLDVCPTGSLDCGTDSAEQDATQMLQLHSETMEAMTEDMMDTKILPYIGKKNTETTNEECAGQRSEAECKQKSGCVWDDSWGESFAECKKPCAQIQCDFDTMGLVPKKQHEGMGEFSEECCDRACLSHTCLQTGWQKKVDIDRTPGQSDEVCCYQKTCETDYDCAEYGKLWKPSPHTIKMQYLADDVDKCCVDPGECRAAITVKVKSDRYPMESSWKIFDPAGGVLLAEEFASKKWTRDSKINELRVCAKEAGEYTFVMYDSFGDGLCCKYGNGSYEVKVDQKIVASGGNFYYQARTKFKVS